MIHRLESLVALFLFVTPSLALPLPHQYGEMLSIISLPFALRRRVERKGGSLMTCTLIFPNVLLFSSLSPKLSLISCC